MEDLKTIYCDFDGTITKKDALAEFFELYADELWLTLEEDWKAEKISSKECLEGQLKLVKKISEEELNSYIKQIEIDDYFIEFYKKIKSKGMKFVILSDGLDMFIKKTLEKYNLVDIPYFANSFFIDFCNNGLEFSVEFNNSNPHCKSGSGTCKCSKIEDSLFCYIGDGLSDRCIAKKAKVLFAKKGLKKYCDDNKIKYIGFETFKDILGVLEKTDK